MKFCVIRQKSVHYFGEHVTEFMDTYLYYGRKYEEGYYWSEYTYEDASFEGAWNNLSRFLNEEEYALTIFESEKAAMDYIKRNFPNPKEHLEVINLSELENSYK